jgi:predicted nucleic acid-binding protein
MLLDTNIVIYGGKPGGEWLEPWTQNPKAALASVSQVEALGFPGITPEEEAIIQHVIGTSRFYPLDDGVIKRAIRLRRIKRMGLADSIIEYGLPLVTRNVHDFQHIPGLIIINPFADRESV